MTPAKPDESRALGTMGEVSLSPVMEALIKLSNLPDFKPENLAALISMQERAEERQAKIAFEIAYAAAKQEIPRVSKRGKKGTGDGKPTIPYALYEDIFDAISGIEIKYGFTRKFTSRVESGKNIAICTLAHSAGHSISFERYDAADAGPGRNAIQADGSTQSYQRRYMTLMVWDVVTKNSDDDGRLAGMAPFITQEQGDQIRDLLRQSESDSGPNFVRFGKWLKEATGATKITEIPAKLFETVIRKLEEKKGK